MFYLHVHKHTHNIYISDHFCPQCFTYIRINNQTYQLHNCWETLFFLKVILKLTTMTELVKGNSFGLACKELTWTPKQGLASRSGFYWCSYGTLNDKCDVFSYSFVPCPCRVVTAWFPPLWREKVKSLYRHPHHNSWFLLHLLIFGCVMEI